MFSRPRYGAILAVLFAAIGVLALARFWGMGLFFWDSLTCHVNGAKWLADGPSAFWADIWHGMVEMGRFQAFLQIVCNLLFCAIDFKLSPDANAWWPLFGLTTFLSLAVFSWGVGAYLESALAGGLVFVAVMSGVTLNLDGHLFDTWPNFAVCFAFWGAALACERRPFRLWAALFYFLAICLGNEAMVLFVLGLAGGRFLCLRGKDRLRECAVPVLGSTLFVLCFVGFRHWFPSRYEGTMLSLSEPWHSFLTWRNISVSQLPGYDFLRLTVMHGRQFGGFLLVLGHHPGWIALLAAFAAACVGAAWFLLQGSRKENREPASFAKETALIWGLAIGVLLNNIPLAVTPKYREWFRSAHHGFYYLYSFYGYAALCVIAVLLFWRVRTRKWAVVALLVFIGLNAVTSGLSSRYYLAEITRLSGHWSLFESLAGRGDIFPSDRVCHVVAPQFRNLPGMKRLGVYRELKARILGLPAVRVDFLEKAPEHLQPGENYYLLSLDDTLSNPLQSRAVLRLASWPSGPVVKGSIWIFANPAGKSGIDRRVYPKALKDFRETSLSPSHKIIRLDDFEGGLADWKIKP
ncbi:MAG: hypothetical protein PW734_00885 [Verrucomicrobium sp.]|nr:hypothetical protein [Verrucomicrobium sp.]